MRNITNVWDVTQCNLIERYKTFDRPPAVSIFRVSSTLKMGTEEFLRNVGTEIHGAISKKTIIQILNSTNTSDLTHTFAKWKQLGIILQNVLVIRTQVKALDKQQTSHM
jgi:hypothetical protein